jgi:hypothetical protein
VIDKPAGLLSRTRLCRVWLHRNWDMLLVAPLRQRSGGADQPDYTRRVDWCVTGNKG